MRTRDERLANSGRRGGALLEFALATPVLLYLLVGVADFARYYSEAAEAGGIAWDAARRNAAGAAQPEPPNGVVIAVETFCECPFEPGVSVGCAQAVCGDYGPPAQYSSSSSVKPSPSLSTLSPSARS